MNFLDIKTIQLDSYNLLSHLDTKLIVHLNDVAKTALKKVNNLNISEKLKKSIYYAALFHDFGKASKFFQERLKTDKKNKYSNHSLISALAGYFYTKDVYVFLAIKYHHSNLSDCDDMCFVEKKDELITIANNIDEEIVKIYKNFGIEFDLKSFIEFIESIDDFGLYIELEENNFFDFLIVFSALIYADKENAIFKNQNKELKIELKSDFVENYKKTFIKPKFEIDFIREKIYKESINIDPSKDIFFIELPTGAGKTFILMNIAMQFNKKIFYLLPFITLIEQNASIFKEVLKFNGIDTEDNRVFYEKHSLSGSFSIKNSDEYDLDKREFLSDTFNSNILVTTFNQFFYSFFKSKNSFLKRAINIANSVIVIDEIQAIKEELFFVIEELFRFLIDKFNCKIVIATATMPKIEINNCFYVKKIDEILDENELKFFDRYDIDLSIKEVDEESILDLVYEKIEYSKDLLFRVNTINAANYLFDNIKDAILLTSVIPPILRKQRIKRIKESGGIVVATQIIQAGVDISLEDGFEELAPLDMLVQSMGRRNRSGEKRRGFADLIRFKFEGFDGSRVYNQSLINRTLALIKDKGVVSEIELRDILKKYYLDMGKRKDFLQYMQDFNFKTVDKNFELIDNVKTISFFCIIDERSQRLWEDLQKLEEKNKNLTSNFWDEKRKIEEEFNKIKKEVFLYTANVRIYNPSSDIAKIDSNFEKVFYFYKADSEIFDIDKGVNLKHFLQKEDIFW